MVGTAMAEDYVDPTVNYDELLVQRRAAFRSDTAAQVELKQWYSLPDGQATEPFKHLVDTSIKDYKEPVLYQKAHGRGEQSDVVYQDPTGRFVLIVDRASPVREVAGDKTDASLVHVLAVPTAKIYNIVDVDGRDCQLLNDMAKVTAALFNQQGFRQKVIRVVYANTVKAMKRKNDMPEHHQAVILGNFFRDLLVFVDTKSGNDLHFAFHPHPTHSIAQLHMHVLVKGMQTSHKSDALSVPLDAVNRVVCGASLGTGMAPPVQDDPTWQSIRHRFIAVPALASAA
ncbi:hypothetical protein H4R34_001901 [Dimargaris verticillata]|uniref:Uncharacterized protein n=1 Tax=Dimargaris verticillata TaxID=2761393 RepID=A0A9W8B3J4_9FUNG|nr:hypothetical protein H4R34_001901 [Dimargaris verticillata]